MEILAIGSCISISILHMLKMQSVFENQRVIFDKLPWNFFDESIEIREDNDIKINNKSRLKYFLKSVDREKISGADYVLIDFFTLFKPIVRGKYTSTGGVSGKNSKRCLVLT